MCLSWKQKERTDRLLNMVNRISIFCTCSVGMLTFFPTDELFLLVPVLRGRRAPHYACNPDCLVINPPRVNTTYCDTIYCQCTQALSRNNVHGRNRRVQCHIVRMQLLEAQIKGLGSKVSGPADQTSLTADGTDKTRKEKINMFRITYQRNYKQII